MRSVIKSGRDRSLNDHMMRVMSPVVEKKRIHRLSLRFLYISFFLNFKSTLPAPIFDHGIFSVKDTYPAVAHSIRVSQ